MRSCFIGLFLVVGIAISCSAKDRHLPLPPQVSAAKTVFIDNQSGMAKIGDKAYEQLQKWGRFQIVQGRKEADLILLFSAHEYNRGYVTSGTTTTGTVDEGGNVNLSSSPTYSHPVTVGYTYLTVIDPKSGDSLWSDSKKWGNLYTGFHSATKGLIDELEKRINDEQPSGQTQK